MLNLLRRKTIRPQFFYLSGISFRYSIFVLFTFNDSAWVSGWASLLYAVMVLEISCRPLFSFLSPKYPQNQVWNQQLWSIRATAYAEGKYSNYKKKLNNSSSSTILLAVFYYLYKYANQHSSRNLYFSNSFVLYSKIEIEIDSYKQFLQIYYAYLVLSL